MINEQCAICGSSRALDVHHIISRGMGGTSRIELERPANKIIICRSCHIEITENRWHLERDDSRLVVSSEQTGAIIMRRLFNSRFDPSQYFHKLNLLSLA